MRLLDACYSSPSVLSWLSAAWRTSGRDRIAAPLHNAELQGFQWQTNSLGFKLHFYLEKQFANPQSNSDKPHWNHVYWVCKEDAFTHLPALGCGSDESPFTLSPPSLKNVQEKPRPTCTCKNSHGFESMWCIWWAFGGLSWERWLVAPEPAEVQAGTQSPRAVDTPRGAVLLPWAPVLLPRASSLLSTTGGCWERPKGTGKHHKPSSSPPPRAWAGVILALEQGTVPSASCSLYILWVNILMWIALGGAWLPINLGTNSKNAFVSK